ncbi:MAG: hypothetical protein J5968_00760 [Oscillospiraceae bacterium]|nr:hypothetical protein [Oscillospiraceae bacterium]
MEKIRFLGILIAMALVFTLTPVVALADDDISNTDSESVSDSADTGDSTDDTDTDSGESGEGTDETDTEDSTDDATEGDSDTTEADDTTASDEEITDDDDIIDNENANNEVIEEETTEEGTSADETTDVAGETPVAGETTPEKAEEAAVPETTPVNTDTSVVDPAAIPAVTSLDNEIVTQPETKPVELTEEEKRAQETYEKNKNAAESWYVYFYLREEGEQVIANAKFGEYKNGDVAAEAGEKPTEVTTTNSNDVSKWKQEGYTEKAVASGKLGADLVRAIATGDGSHRYESLLPEDYNGSNSFVLDDFKLNDDNKSKLEELGNVEWYVAKVVSGKIHVDGITVKVEEPKAEESKEEMPVIPDEEAPGDNGPVITSDSDSDDDDDDDSYYALVAIDDEGVPLAVNPISPAAAIFIADEAVPLASLPVTGGSAAGSSGASFFFGGFGDSGGRIITLYSFPLASPGFFSKENPPIRFSFSQ